MRITLRLAVVIAIFATISRTYGETFIVDNGQPNAQIIIKKDAIRPTELAAEQIQEYIEKVSGARLSIKTSVDETIPVKIYVGKSDYTDKLGIDGDQFPHGGFHVKSGTDWLALVGKDKAFSMPTHMWPNKHNDLPAVYEEWDKATGETFRYPYATIWKCHNRKLNINEKDTHGSFNATAYFLRSLGVRWYLPDELGEVIPEQKTIALPEIDKEIRPDFSIRWPKQHARRFGGVSKKEALWQWRLGWSEAPEIIGPGNCYHDIAGVTGREETRKAYPEYYALYNGVRDDKRQCLSSEGLFKANLRYIKALYDIFGDSFVQVMPADAYTSICQCKLCKGKDTPEKGYRGLLSNYVWDYFHRVATELYKTHPGIRVTCQAYGTYRIPPDNIETFPPNVVLNLAQHRNLFYDEEKKKMYLDEREAFIDMLPEGGKLMINEKYRSGDHKPMFYPHIIAEDLKSLKGISLGGIYEVFRKKRDRETGEKGIPWLAAMHLNLYVTSRYWWDADQDVEELLDYYYNSFYGPAAKEMKAFIEYSEKHWAASAKDSEVIEELFTLINNAKDKVDEGSVYAKRIALIYDFIKPLEALQKQFERGRDNAPVAHIAGWKIGTITIDGKLEEDIWSKWPKYRLKELRTGAKPSFETTFKVLWDGGSESVVFGVKCEEDNTDKLNTPAKKNDDTQIFAGDAVEITFETLSHSYYQIAISPNGVMADLDRKNGIETLWASEAEVATYVGEDFWSLEIRIPVAGENQAEILPLNGVAGSEPRLAYPWYFNVGRVRVRGDDKQVFSFTGQGFHNVMKFAELRPRKIEKKIRKVEE